MERGQEQEGFLFIEQNIGDVAGLRNKTPTSNNSSPTYSSNMNLEDIHNKKRIKLNKTDLSDIKENLIKNIRELENCWRKREQYLKNGELPLLKDNFRRLAYNFNRIANILFQCEGFDFSIELKSIAKILREISSNKYFLMAIGVNPLERIQSKIEEALKISEKVIQKTE